MTSIYAIRTVITPRVMPPKPEPKIIKPAMTFEEDAAQIRHRFRGDRISHQASPVSQMMRTPEQEQRRIARLRETITIKSRDVRQKVINSMTRPMRASEISAASGVPSDTVRGHLGRLHAEGLVAKETVNRVAVWTLVK